MNFPLALAAPQIIDQPKVGTSRLIQVIQRRAWLIILFALLGGGAAYAFSTTLPRLYTASSIIVPAAQHSAITELQGALRGAADSDPMLQVRTELQAISSPQLLGQVADELHLEARKEFNSTLAEPSWLDKTIGPLKAKILGQAGQPATVSASAIKEGIVSQVTRNLVLFNDNRSMTVTVSFTSGDPQLSADFINKLVAAYRHARASQGNLANEQANGTLAKRIDQLTAEIAGFEKQAAALRDKNQYIGLRAGSLGQQQLEELATQATRATAERSQIQAAWERASSLARRGASDELSSVLTSSTVAQLREREAVATQRLSELSVRYGAGYPAVRDAQANLNTIRGLLAGEIKRIVDSLASQLQVARQNEADTQRQLVSARESAVKNTGVQTELDSINQEVTGRRALIRTLQVSLQQTMSQPSAEVADVRVLSVAQAPSSASSPQPKLAAIFGVAAGGVLGFLLAFTTVRGAPSATMLDSFKARGLPIYGTLPDAPSQGRRSLLTGITTRAAAEPAETLRTLRFRIRNSGKDIVPRIVAFIPAESSENGASIAFAFARQAAMDGERVLLVEGNLQSPELALLAESGSYDLLEALEGDMYWRDALVQDAESSLDLLLATQRVNNAQTLLTSVRFQNLLVEAKEDYNLIVLSSPSTEMTANALALANCAEANVLIFDGKGAKSRDISRFIEDLVMTSSGPVAAMLTHIA